MKELKLKKVIVMVFFGLFLTNLQAQLYIDSSGLFYLQDQTDFTTSNTVINHHPDGVFVKQATASMGPTLWVDPDEFVNGFVSVIGQGITEVNIGKVGPFGYQSPVTITTAATDSIQCSYYFIDPASIGTAMPPALSYYELSDVEYWLITREDGTSADVAVSGLMDHPMATYNGDTVIGPTPIILRYDTTNRQWEDYDNMALGSSASRGFGYFTLGLYVDRPPEVYCSDTTLKLNQANLLTIDTSFIVDSVVDNSLDSVWLSKTTFTCADLGPNLVTVYAIDTSGLIDSCVSTVTIEFDVTTDTIAVAMNSFNLGTVCLTQDELVGSNFSYTSCELPKYGLLVDYNDTCFSYTQTSTNKYLDTACVIICDTACGMCDTTVLIFVPLPDKDTLYVGPVIPSTNENTCVTLESTFMTGMGTGTCDGTGLSSNGIPLTITGLCVSYPVSAPVFTGDSACIVVCDTIENLIVCDTTCIIYVPDTIAPTLICKNDTVYVDDLGTVIIDTSHVVNTVYDNTLINAVWSTPTSFSCADIGQNTVTVYARDTNRNVNSCTSIITVLDTVSPIARCQNITIQLDSNGEASIIASDIDAGSTDNCAISSLVIDRTNFDCSNLGFNTVTLTVTDIYGNLSTCTSTVTVEDNIAPIVYCSGDKNVVLRNTVCEYVVEDFTTGISSWDNCTTSDNVEYTQTPDAGSTVILENDSVTITLSGTDASGNTSSCSLVVYARCQMEIDIPQFISPNGDGKNDTWEIPELANYSNNVVKLFNRWGDLVFEQKGYYTGWGGVSTVNNGLHQLTGNSILPDGTYYYFIELGVSGMDPYTGYMQIKR